MTANELNQMADLTEQATHSDTMKFSRDDAERLTYLEMKAEVYQAERAAIAAAA